MFIINVNHRQLITEFSMTKPIDKIINLCKNNTNLKILAHHFLGNGTWLICATINSDDMSYLLFPLSTETSTRDIPNLCKSITKFFHEI